MVVPAGNWVEPPLPPGVDMYITCCVGGGGSLVLIGGTGGVMRWEKENVRALLCGFFGWEPVLQSQSAVKHHEGA